MSVYWKIGSALVSFELALLASGQNAHAQCGGGASCGSHGGGHVGGSSAAHLGGAHGGAGHAAFGGVGGARAWGGVGHHAIQHSPYASAGGNTSFGISHGSHFATGSWSSHGVRNRIIGGHEDITAGPRQTTMSHGWSALASESPTFAGGIGRFHLRADAGDYGYHQGSPMGQHLGHVVLPDWRDPALRSTTTRSSGARALNSVPGARPMLEAGRRNAPSLVRENILRRAYRLPAPSLPSLRSLGDSGITAPHRAAAPLDLSFSLGHRCGESSVPSLLPQKHIANPRMANDGTVVGEEPIGNLRATLLPPTTSAPAETDSATNAEDGHH